MTPRGSRILRTVLQIIVLINTLVFFAAWAVLLASGTFAGVLFSTGSYPNIPFLHLVAELGVAGIPTAIGVIGWWRDWRCGPHLLLFGLGAGCYAAINSIGWALNHSVPAAIHMCFGAIVSLAVLFVLARGVRFSDSRGDE